MDLTKTLAISAAGMQVQGTRLRVVAENLANSESLATTPGGDPYRRKTVTFKNQLDRAMGVDTVRVANIGVDRSEFVRRYDPGNPAAAADGYVLAPNVKPLVEMMDMCQAQRGYDANVAVIDVAKGMLQRTIEILRG